VPDQLPPGNRKSNAASSSPFPCCFQVASVTPWAFIATNGAAAVCRLPNIGCSTVTAGSQPVPS